MGLLWVLQCGLDGPWPTQNFDWVGHTGGAYSASPDSLAVFKGPTSKWREERRGKKGKGEGGYRRKREGYGPPKKFSVALLCTKTSTYRSLQICKCSLCEILQPITLTLVKTSYVYFHRFDDRSEESSSPFHFCILFPWIRNIHIHLYFVDNFCEFT